MTNRILVTYASRASSTKGVAEAIGRTLEDRGLVVDVHPMQDVHGLAEYQAVVAGSAIRYDKWLPEAIQFVEQHQQELVKKPFAAFVVCLAMATQNKRRQQQAIETASSYLKPVRTLVPTVSEGLFAGVLDLSKLPVGYRILFRAVMLTGFFKEGDFRDWDAIQQWAHGLSTELVVTDNQQYATVAQN